MKRRAALAASALLAVCACTSSAPVPARPSSSPTSAPEIVLTGEIVVSEDDVVLLDLDDGVARPLTDLPGPQFDADAHGILVVFRDSRDGVNVDDEIAVTTLRGGRARNLTRAPGSNEWGPVWSPDGAWIAFSSDRGGMPQVYVMNAAGGERRLVSDGWGEYPSWSPDGEQIAYASYVGGTTPDGDPDYDVFVANIDGSETRNITDDAGSYDGYPSWSPDGEWIAFEATGQTPDDFEPPTHDPERTSDEDIWVMRPDGSERRNLTNDLERVDEFPDWGPTRLIVYSREGSIVVLDPETGGSADVTAATGITGVFPAWVT